MCDIYVNDTFCYGLTSYPLLSTLHKHTIQFKYGYHYNICVSDIYCLDSLFYCYRILLCVGIHTVPNPVNAHWHQPNLQNAIPSGTHAFHRTIFMLVPPAVSLAFVILIAGRSLLPGYVTILAINILTLYLDVSGLVYPLLLLFLNHLVVEWLESHVATIGWGCP